MFWESESSTDCNYQFLFCEWGIRCIFQSFRNTFTPSNCYVLQIKPAFPRSSLVTAADAVFESAFLKLWLPNQQQASYWNLCHFLKANVSVWTCDPVCSARFHMFFSFKWNRDHPRGRLFLLVQHMVTSKWNHLVFLSESPAITLSKENMNRFSVNKL